MQVIIDEVISRVRAIDGRSALAPETLRAIVDTVLAAVREEMAHDQRVMRERTSSTEVGREH
ncbi:hypothetical protein [Nitrospira sp. BLG_1]|uniref:hypothetical protein n=1 Tax=Nitrospira sp. BLG_1 TaxID=3395883 RepID=UPI0039BD591A